MNIERAQPMLLLLGGLLLVATGCQVPLTDSGQYLACTPDLECREGYECRLVDEQYACVPSDSNVGTELDAGGMDTEDTTTDVSEDGSTDDVTEEDTNGGDTLSCPQDCDADGLVCNDATGECVACVVDGDCGDAVCFESPNGAAENACVECRSDEQCGAESFCDLGNEPAEAKCVPKDAKWFLERLAQEYRRTACEATFSDECAPTLTTFFVANRAPSKSECLEYGVDYFTEQSDLYVEMSRAANSGKYEPSWFDLDVAEQCLTDIAAELGEATCTSTFDNLPEACKSAIRGTVDSGPCFNQFMCPEGGYCDLATDSVCGGTCKPAAFPEEGQACSVDDPCDPTKDLVCVRYDNTRECVEKHSQATDESCAGAAGAQACGPGLICQRFGQPLELECKEYHLVGPDESCSSDLDLCEPGLSCAGASGDPICVPIPTSGDACDAMIECGLGSYCNGTDCVAELGLNEICSGGGLCEPGLVCSSSGRCVQQDDLDPPC
jgi:hypothetical protein